jgi:hypothetical protein
MTRTADAAFVTTGDSLELRVYATVDIEVSKATTRPRGARTSAPHAR